MRRFTPQEFSAAQRADELAIAGLYLATDRDDAGPALEFPVFERAVIDIHLLGFG